MFFVIEAIIKDYEQPQKETAGFWPSFRNQQDPDPVTKIFHRKAIHDAPEKLALANPTLWIDGLIFHSQRNLWIFDCRRNLWLLRSNPGLSLQDFLEGKNGNWSEGYYKDTAANPYREEG